MLSDGDWELVSNVDMGFLDDYNHVDVFVVRDEKAVDLIERLKEDIDSYKSFEPTIDKETFVKKYRYEDYIKKNASRKRVVTDEENKGFWEKL